MSTGKEPHEVDDLDAGWDDEEPDEDVPEEPEPQGLTREEREARAAARKARLRAKAAAKKERRKARALAAAEKQKKSEPRKREAPPERPTKPRKAARAPEELAETQRHAVRRDWIRMAVIVLVVILVGGIGIVLVRR